MSIEAVAAAAAAVTPAAITPPAITPAMAAPAAAGTAPQGSGGAVFDAILDGISQVNREMQATQQAVQDMALGKSDNLHQVMMNLEQTRLSFELLLQVRNRVLEAYQELMRMQV